MSKTYVVRVHHPIIEANGRLYPNMPQLGLVVAENEIEALAKARVVFGDSHSVNLIMVEEK